MARIKDSNKMNDLPTCGCGRSPTGNCCGWHRLSEEAYQKAKDAYELAEYQQQAQNLWFTGGSCTGGSPE
jgi:hypothetical protein